MGAYPNPSWHAVDRKSYDVSLASSEFAARVLAAWLERVPECRL
jgi:hypothetical protein